MHPGSREDRERDERGAVLAIVGAALTVIVVVAAFAVDLGVQRVVRRDMQALADVVALDLAREIDGRTRAQLAAEGRQDSPSSALALSLARNDDTIGEDLAVAVSWGSWDGETFDATVDPPSAVRVVASATTDFAFASGEGGATRTAYAQADSTACYQLGSWAAAVRSGDATLLGPLNGLLGLDLDLLSYRGIAGADLRLAQLAAEPRIGSETRLLSSPIAYGDLVQASIDALRKEDDPTNEAAIQALGVLLRGSAGLPAVTVGRALNIGAGDAAALDTDLNLLDVLAGSLAVANGERAVEIPNLQAGVPGLGAKVSSTLTVQHAASMACGTPGSPESVATSGQLAGEIQFPLLQSSSLNFNAGLIRLQLKTGGALTQVHVNLGDARGMLTGQPAVHCGDGTPEDPDRFSVDVTTSLAAYELRVDVPVTGTVRLLGGIRADVELTLRVKIVAPPGDPGGRASLSLPPNDTLPVTVGGGAPVLTSVVPSVVAPSVTIAGLPALPGDVALVSGLVLDALVNNEGAVVRKSLLPLAREIDAVVVGPTAKLLGLRLAGADVYGVGATCANPRLAG